MGIGEAITNYELQAIGFSSSILARTNYDYDDSAQVWIDCINSLEPPINKWGTGKFKQLPPINSIAFLSNLDFINVCFDGLEAASNWNKSMILKDLDVGKITKYQVYSMASESANIHNYWMELLLEQNRRI